MSEIELLERSVERLRSECWPTPRLVLVLGSGMRDFVGALEDAKELRFAELPDWPRPGTDGHGDSLFSGRVEGLDVICLSGRAHLYEGYSAAEVVRPLRSLKMLGAEKFLLTNAAGGIGGHLQVGDLMLIEDQINLTGSSPLVGPAEPRLGPRFPDQSQLYCPSLGQMLSSIDPGLQRGVYAGMLGPGYETPAEIEMLRATGAAAVGMSTVLEVMALAAMGARLAGISLISNLAAGCSTGPLHHDEVLVAGKAGAEKIEGLIRGLCGLLAKP